MWADCKQEIGVGLTHGHRHGRPPASSNHPWAKLGHNMDIRCIRIIVCKVQRLFKLKTKTGINDSILPGYTFRDHKRPHLLCHILDCGKTMQFVCLLDSFEPCGRKRKSPILPVGEVSRFSKIDFDQMHTVRRTPGDTQFTRIDGAAIMAKDFMRWICAAFVTA